MFEEYKRDFLTEAVERGLLYKQSVSGYLGKMTYYISNDHQIMFRYSNQRTGVSGYKMIGMRKAWFGSRPYFRRIPIKDFNEVLSRVTDNKLRNMILFRLEEFDFAESNSL